MKIKRGSTSVRRLIFIADTSKTDGSGLANLVYNSSGLVAYYFAGDLNNEVQITLVTATLGTYASGGFIAVDNTNMPGWYEIGIPDAALDGGNEVAIQLRGATNMAPVNVYIELDTVDYQTDAFGALKPTNAGRTLDVTATGAAGIDLGNVENPTTTLNLSGTTISTTQQVASVSGRVTANTDQWGGVTVTGMPLPTSSYTAPPSASTNATAVRTELATELARIDATVSSRLATASYTGPLNATATAAAVWNAALATYTTAGSFGARVVRSTNSNAELFLNAAGHGAAVLHDCDPDSIPEDAFITGALSARALAADAAAEVATATRTELATELARIDATVSSRATASDLTTLLSRIGAFTGSGVNTVLGFLKALASKAASTPSDIGGTYSAATDSTEAIRDAMQAGTGDASQATLVQVQGTVDAIAASISGAAINVVSRVADGGSITLYAGDDMRVRSGTEVAVTISDVGGAIYTRLDSIGVAQLAFGAARPTQPAGAITGTIASLTQAGSGSSQTLTINIEIEDGGERLAPADNYVWQIVSSDAQGSEYDTYTEVEGTLTLKRRVAVPVYS